MPQAWDKQQAETFVSMADIIVPERRLQFAMVADLLPFDAKDRFTFIDIGCGEGLLSQTIVDRFSNAICHATDVADEMITKARLLLAPYGQRVAVSRHNIHEPDYLNRIVAGPVGVITSSLAIHHCSDAEKACLYRAAFEKLTSPGAMVIIDAVRPASDHGVAINKKHWQECIRRQWLELSGGDAQYESLQNVPILFYEQPAAEDQPATLLDNLRMVADAGFKGVDCFWKKGPFAVFGGYK